MGFDVINIGATANDGTGDPLRTAFDKTNDNFALAVEGPAGAVTADTVALFDGTTGKLIKGGGQVNADIVVTSDARLSDARTPLAHGNEAHTSTFVDAAGAAAAAPVQSVNTQTGVVVLAAADVGADASGTASSAVSSHAAVTTSVHGIADTASLVVGPASATSGRVAVYDGTTGKLLQDGTKAEADLVVGPAAATDGAVALFDQTGGKLLREGGFPFNPYTFQFLVPPGQDLVRSSSPIINAGLFGAIFTLHAWPIPVPLTIDRIGLNVNVAESGCLIRLGLYAFDPNAATRVGSLLLDIGEIDASTTGNKFITFPSPLSVTSPIVWVARHSNTTGTLRVRSYNASSYSLRDPIEVSPVNNWFNSGIAYGPFPSTPPELAAGTGFSALYALRVGAYL
jgi:hypothetical protein